MCLTQIDIIRPERSEPIFKLSKGYGWALEQWRIKEIVEELELNEGRVKQAIFRAVKKLRVSMQDMQREHHE